MNIYVSTSAIKDPFNLEKVLQTYNEMGVWHIELGSSHDYIPNVDMLLEKYNHISFVMHNYFPPQKETFALNLSSIDETVRIASIEHAKTAIDLCVKIGSPLYSIHAGMVSNPRKIKFFEGFIFDEFDVNRETYDSCFSRLVNSCNEINEYAKKNEIKFAVETSGGHPNKYKYLMMTTQHEFERLMHEICDENFGILLDIGHYNISTVLNPKEQIEIFINRFKNRIFKVHIHHNDGSNDQHLPPTEKELNLLSLFPKETIFVLESMGNDQIDIKKSLNQINSCFNKS